MGVASAFLILGPATAPRAPGPGVPVPLPPQGLLHGWWSPATLTLEHAIPAALLAALALGLVLVCLPVGIFALVATAVGAADGAGAQGLALALLAVYAAQAVVSVALVALAAVRGERPRPFLAAIRDALVTALATGSSAASLPVEARAAIDGLGREPAAAAFALSLGTALSKAGTAAFLGAPGTAALLLAGLAVGVPRLAPVVLAATVAALATPPIAGGGFVMLGFVAQQAGLPLDLVALLLGVPFVGKANTPVNALGRPRDPMGPPGGVDSSPYPFALSRVGFTGGLSWLRPTRS